MPPASDDLLPLFLAEARERLDRLAALAEMVDRDGEAVQAARRELHALKGACRMMGLHELAALSHQAEEVMAAPAADATLRLTVVLDRMAATVSGLAGRVSGQAQADDAVASAGREEFQASLERVRVDRRVLEGLADGAAELRVLAVGGGPHRQRLLHLAQLAARAADDDGPAQALQGLAGSLRRLAVRFDRAQRRLQRLAEQQLETVLELQVQPLRPYLQVLARHARELGRALGREVHVTVKARDSRLDRRIIASLEDAFLHLVRNAVDHGLEPPEERQASGKPREGRITLRAGSAGPRVRISVTDDGRGVRPDLVREAAVRRGVVTAEAASELSDDEALQLVFRSGVTTVDDATEISGRGVGLDAVAASVWLVGGDVSIDSAPGHGTTVSLELPTARRGERVVILSSGGAWAALPAGVVRGFTRLTPDMIVVEAGRRLVRRETRRDSFVSLAEVLRVKEGQDLVLIEGVTGGRGFCLAAEAVEGEEEVLVRPWPAVMGASEPFEGMALLATGRPIPVVAPPSLTDVSPAWRREPAVVPARGPQRVLLVDDSTTTREMIRRLLEDHGFHVIAVSSAEGAARKLAESPVDCLVTDIEMPGMDGLELTRRLRQSEANQHLPVVVVSTRDRPEDRVAGLTAGADAYLSKQELVGDELIKTIRRVGER